MLYGLAMFTLHHIPVIRMGLQTEFIESIGGGIIKHIVDVHKNEKTWLLLQ